MLIRVLKSENPDDVGQVFEAHVRAAPAGPDFIGTYATWISKDGFLRSAFVETLGVKIVSALELLAEVAE